MKSKLSIALLAILIFLLGAVTGGTSHYLYCKRQKISYSTSTYPKVDDVVEWMAKELKLDAQQKVAVRAHIVHVREQYRALSQDFRPRYNALRKDSDDRINALLREDQKPLFEKFLEKIKSLRPAAAQPPPSSK
jgi:uncharacterized membrane protein